MYDTPLHSEDSGIRVSPEVVVRRWGEDRLILHPIKSSDARNPVVVETPTGVAIVDAIRQHGSQGVDALVAEICDSFEGACAEDVLAFLGQLAEIGVVSGVPKVVQSADAPVLRSQFEYVTEAFHAPCHLAVELTRRCNFNCSFCYTRISGIATQEATLPEYRKVLEEALELGVLEFTLTGGEVLLRPDIVRNLVEFLASSGVRLTVFTNGSLIEKHPEVVDIFAEYGPLIEITMYSASPETHQSLTGRDIRPVIRGIEILLKRGIRPALKTTVSRTNFPEVDRIARMANSWGLEFRFDCFLLNRPDRATTDIANQRLTAEEIAFLEKRFPDRISLLKDQADDLINVDFGKAKLPKLPFFHCAAGLTSGFLGADLRYSVCCLIRDELYTYDLRQGALKEAFSDFTDTVRQSELERKTECNHCSIINLCRHGACPARIINGEQEDIEYFCAVAKHRAQCLFGNSSVH